MNPSKLAEVLARGEDRGRLESAQRCSDWIIYGAGRMGRAWAAALADRGLRVHAFIDRQVNAASGLPVFKLEECPDDLRGRCSVLLAMHNPGVDIGKILCNLHEAGFSKIWLLQDLIDAWPGLAHFWLAPASETLPHSDDIFGGYEVLADELSRELMVSLLDHRLNGNVDGLPTPDLESHYLPHGVPQPESPLRYIDCGAYTGDTIENFLRNGLTFDEIAAFEPDPLHFPRLCQTCVRQRASLFPCGVWDSMTQLRFSSDDSASHIDAAGEIIVQAVTLDQALANFAPTLIKMDIEGAESRALLGSRNTIEIHRPFLSISTYHKPRDLWELMLQVHRWDLNYRFRLRSHAYNGFETVLYAEPA